MALSENITTSSVFDVFGKASSVWFIGIGGVSMSSLALTSRDRGLRVGGSDRCASAVTERLAKSGFDVRIGHRYTNVDGYDAVIYNAAIAADNPEMLRAKETGIPCFTRAQYLGYVMSDYKTRIGVSGTHGKSTTTSMIAHMFLAAGLDPTIESGAELTEIGGAYRSGGKDYFVFEACEYTDSFLSFFPTVAVVLNVDTDHLDYFSGLDQIVDSFSRYMGIAGTAVINADDANTVRAAANYKGTLLTFGIKNENAAYTAKNIRFERGTARFDIYCGTALLTPAKLSIPGEHNIYNALAAAAAGHICGIPAGVIAGALESFTGCKRRFERVGTMMTADGGSADVYDDFAHHPREIAATLGGARKLGYKKIICIYQPHTYSRTYELLDDFPSALGLADETILVDIYAARENNSFGVSSYQIAERIPNASYIPDLCEAAKYVKCRARAGELIITMGAGTVWQAKKYLFGG